MPSLKGIRKRIVSTKSTQKITRAMKMVAGAKLTRAQQRIVAMRPYAVKTGEVLQSVAKTMGSSADTQNDTSIVLESRHASTARLAQSITATRYRNPRPIGT